MLDIHSHIIPEVDDGCKTLQEAIELIKEEINQGVDEIIATPHYDINRYKYNKDLIIKNYNLLLEEVKKQNLKIKIYLGNEIFIYPNNDFIEKLKNKELFTLMNSNYILIEFDVFENYFSLDDLLYTISINNFNPVIAHIERYDWITEKDIKTIISYGGIIQVNASSLINKKSRTVHKRAKKYLKKGYVNYIASDIHYTRHNYMALAMKKYGKYLNRKRVIKNVAN